MYSFVEYWPSCLLASAQVGSLPLRIITASITFSTSKGGRPYDLISVMSFLFNDSRAWKHYWFSSLFTRVSDLNTLQRKRSQWVYLTQRLFLACSRDWKIEQQIAYITSLFTSEKSYSLKLNKSKQRLFLTAMASCRAGRASSRSCWARSAMCWHLVSSSAILSPFWATDWETNSKDLFIKLLTKSKDLFIKLLT